MYKKYHQDIKDTIIETGNINAYPELNIPRTTALYWLRNSKNTIKGHKKKDTLLRQELNNLTKNKKLLEIENKFLRELVVVYKKKQSKNQQEKIILDKIKKYRKYLSVENLCRLSGLTTKKYYLYINSQKPIIFEQRKPNQLSIQEQRELVCISKDKKLNHLSIKQLQLYAFRNNIIHCHYDTWRKYVNNFNPKRNQRRLIKEIKKRNNVLNTTNKIWHIDITYFRGKDNKPIYLQVILDGHSRAVISWNISKARSCDITIKTIKNATMKEKANIIICDGGGENNNLKVNNLLNEENISRILAKDQYRYINAKIEAFFNILKNRYIDKYKRYSIAELYETIKNSIDKYNNSPSTHFYGATPSEVNFKNIDVNFLKEELRLKQNYAKIRRKRIYNQEVNHSRATRSKNNSRST